MKLNKNKKTTVLYHSDNDGFGAAYAIWTVLGHRAEYTPVQYGQPVPEIGDKTEVLIIVDFSYDRLTCEKLAEQYEICILDHHKTAEEELKGLPYAHFNPDMSGCTMAWVHFCRSPIPEFLLYVQDRDLWRFELSDSDEVNLYISSFPHEFDIWHSMNLDRFMNSALLAGAAIKRFRDDQIKYALKNVRMMYFVVGGVRYEVPVLNASANVSEIGNDMCEQYPTASFSVTYCDRKDVRTWSLRSVGDFDVSEIAKQSGGGGHKNAAGFTTEIGWPEQHPEEFLQAFEEKSNEVDSSKKSSVAD